jgi:hypothetical protein
LSLACSVARVSSVDLAHFDDIPQSRPTRSNFVRPNPCPNGYFGGTLPFQKLLGQTGIWFIWLFRQPPLRVVCAHPNFARRPPSGSRRMEIHCPHERGIFLLGAPHFQLCNQLPRVMFQSGRVRRQPYYSPLVASGKSDRSQAGQALTDCFLREGHRLCYDRGSRHLKLQAPNDAVSTNPGLSVRSGE